MLSHVQPCDAARDRRTRYPRTALPSPAHANSVSGLLSYPSLHGKQVSASMIASMTWFVSYASRLDAGTMNTKSVGRLAGSITESSGAETAALGAERKETRAS
jgi:hypothetical protein